MNLWVKSHFRENTKDGATVLMNPCAEQDRYADTEKGLVDTVGQETMG